MQPSPTEKYGFRIRTRSGAVVDNLLIFGRDNMDAERKLRQIYAGCEILESRRLAVRSLRRGAATRDDVTDLLSVAD